MTHVSGKERKSKRLLLIVAVIVTVWGVMLPALESLPAIRSWIEPLRVRQIDPSAMYYTELQ